MRGDDIRRGFLDFFAERDHKVMPSASLVSDDPTLLFTVAGMVPFKPFFEGQRPPPHPRLVNAQKCVRTNDIENVGITARHQTLFEMLGNFSFGDYFKREAIRWAWELSTNIYGMEPERLWVTVFENDDEAFGLWQEEAGLPASRIIRRGADDNFWWMGVAGPGGPCSEMFYDRGDRPSDVFDDGDTMMEYYNLVFTEYSVDNQMNILGALPKKNVDTGSGLERVAQLLQKVPTAYETDLLAPIVSAAQDATGKVYGRDQKTDTSLRIIAEHSRAAAFLIGDGVLPSNDGRGYVLRRLIRRAVRHAKILGRDDVVIPGVVRAAIANMGTAYPELKENAAFIDQVTTAEEEGFRHTLRTGLAMLDDAVAAASKAGSSSLEGDVGFRLHDTYGFPLELTIEIAQEAGLELDRAGFDALMAEQRDRARAARKDAGPGDVAAQEILKTAGASAFVGYDAVESDGRVTGILRAGEVVRSANAGDEVEVVLDRTSFYPEGGGQIGDAGIIQLGDAKVQVTDTQRRVGELIVHAGKVLSGEIVTGAPAHAMVDRARRAATERSHTATHVLHATLKAALGDHARQAGSLVEPGRLRFDFPHFERVSRGLLEEVEATVNERLLADNEVIATEMSMEQARAKGAVMLFEEKYGDVVRVVDIGGYSLELCGGTHVTRTGQVAAVKILGESSIGANLRRVEALTGAEAIADFRHSRAVLDKIATLLKTSAEDAPARVEKLLADLKSAEKASQAQRQAGEADLAKSIAATAVRKGSGATVVAEVPGLQVGELQSLALSVRNAVGAPCVVVLASSVEGKAGIVAAMDQATAARVQPREIIADAAKAIGGGAGGRGEVATGGGAKPEGVSEALRLAGAAADRVFD